MSHGSGRNLFGNKVEKKFGIKEKSLYLCIIKTFYYVQEKIQDLQEEIIKKIKNKCSTIIGENQQITFRNVFGVWITEGMYEDDGRVQYAAYGILPDGTVMAESFGDSIELSLVELDIYELAHIIDILESDDFTVEDI